MSTSTTSPGKEDAIDVLKRIEDPEIRVDIWTMGLIYDLQAGKDLIRVTMTFTTPTCPYGPQLLEEVESRLLEKGFKKVEVHITFTPPWQPSEELKEMLGMGL